MKSIRDFSFKEKRVLVRCDFNVPLDKRGNILDDFRIKKTLPTVQYLINAGTKIILMSHLGEPDGVVVENLKLDKTKEKLEELLHTAIIKTNDCFGDEVAKKISELKSGEIVLLENLRFHKEETEGDLPFAKKLSALGEIYINDAFSDCHRQDASIVGVPQFLPSGAGLLLQNELLNLNKVLVNPKKPIVVLIGGIKAETKAKFIEKISEVADWVIVNGPMAKEISDKKIAFTHPEKIVIPVDSFDQLDIGKKTIALFCQKVVAAKMVIWNGPFGKFEDTKYGSGTLAIANAIIASGAFSVVGGGETIEFLQKAGMLDKFSHVSTGGGAMLDFLSGEELPGLEALK